MLAFFGTAFALGTNWAATFAMPTLVRVAPEIVVETLPGRIMVSLIVSFLLFIVGWFLFAFATLRGRVYPQAAAALLMFGVVMLITNFALSGISGMVFGVAVAWLGFILFTGGGAPTKQPKRVR